MNILNLKDIISIKLKPRHDSYSDQWNRVLMCKSLLVISLVIGIDYFQDEISCIVPDNASIDSKFVESTCWITGFYIYPELRYLWKHTGYHGIPKDLSKDGINAASDELCTVYVQYGVRNLKCRPLRKEFFLQYQWYPFFVATVGLCFYLPYLLFRIVNTDMVNLKEVMESENPEAESITKSFFNYGINPKIWLRCRIYGTILVKVLYVVVNLVSFHAIDNSMNGKFLDYGVNWVNWAQLNNTMAHDPHLRGFSKPANELLPPMGICEIHEASRDVRNTLLNTHKFICELSQNVLYQYCFLLMWFLITISLSISILGLLYEIYTLCAKLLWIVWSNKDAMKIFRVITLREYQYLQLIRSQNPAMYTEVLIRLTQEKLYNNNIFNGHSGEENISLTMIKSV